MKITLMALLLLTFCGVAGAQEDCSEIEAHAFRKTCPTWECVIAVQQCRIANSLERLAGK